MQLPHDCLYDLALKLLDGKTGGELKRFVPELIELRLCKKRTRQTFEGTQIALKLRSNSLDVYRRGCVCALPKIWSQIPEEIIEKGANHGWSKIKSACTEFLLNRIKKEHPKKRESIEKPKIYGTKLNNELIKLNDNGNL